jgi:hypothetical protein
LLFVSPRGPSFAQTPPPVELPPVLNQLILEGATVFTAGDVRWLLDLRDGPRLPAQPDRVATLLQRRYEREGYTAAQVAAEYDTASGALMLRVDEGRIDAIDIPLLRPHGGDHRDDRGARHQRRGRSAVRAGRGSVSVAPVGKMVFRAVLQVTDYLQSVSAEARTRQFHGRELRPGFRQ